MHQNLAVLLWHLKNPNPSVIIIMLGSFYIAQLAVTPIPQVLAPTTWYQSMQ